MSKINSIQSLEQLQSKLEHYCAYQERCHQEVIQKLKILGASATEIDKVVVHLLENNFLNEERFANLFTISKFHQKKWGKIRIKTELKARNISEYLIAKSLKEITDIDYTNTFEELSQKTWDTIIEKNDLKKRKKFCDTLLRKGWESHRVYDKVIELEKTN